MFMFLQIMNKEASETLELNSITVLLLDILKKGLFLSTRFAGDPLDTFTMMDIHWLKFVHEIFINLVVETFKRFSILCFKLRTYTMIERRRWNRGKQMKK